MEKEQSFILYSSLKKLSDKHHEVLTMDECDAAYVRMERVSATPSDALSLATPRDGEIVLNTIPATES